MSYKLFIDDERDPIGDDWVIVRSYDEAISKIKELGCPGFISFDHDLGEGKNGFEIAKELVEMLLDGVIKIEDGSFDFYVHSQNPVGKENIRSFLNNFLMDWENV